MQGTSVCGVLSHNRDISITLPSPIAQRMWTRDRKIVRARVQGRQEWNSVFWPWNGHWTHLYGAWLYYTCAPYDCPCTTLNTHVEFHYGLGRSSLDPIPSWGTIGSRWLLGEGESVFFKSIVPGWLPKCQVVGSTSLFIWNSSNQIQLFKRKEEKKKEEDMKLGRGVYVG